MANFIVEITVFAHFGIYFSTTTNQIHSHFIPQRKYNIDAMPNTTIPLILRIPLKVLVYSDAINKPNPNITTVGHSIQNHLFIK